MFTYHRVESPTEMWRYQVYFFAYQPACWGSDRQDIDFVGFPGQTRSLIAMAARQPALMTRDSSR